MITFLCLFVYLSVLLDPCSGIRCPGNQICQLDENRNPVCRCSLDKCDSLGGSTSSGGDIGPMCGSDGRTYSSECALEDYACRHHKHIRIISRGKCGEGKWVVGKLEPFSNHSIEKTIFQKHRT